jgi:hypothetical protein
MDSDIYFSLQNQPLINLMRDGSGKSMKQQPTPQIIL